MMTTLSCCLLYIASYWLIYPIIMLFIITNKFNQLQDSPDTQLMTFFEQLIYILNSEKIILLVLLFLFLFSRVWIRFFKAQKNNTRINYKMVSDSKIDESAFIIPYIFTIITFNFDIYGWLICLLIYVCIGFIFVQTKKIQTSPVFILSRYHILTNGHMRVITRDTTESFNIKLEENPNGIEVRELVKNVYIKLE